MGICGESQAAICSRRADALLLRERRRHAAEEVCMVCRWRDGWAAPGWREESQPVWSLRHERQCLGMVEDCFREGYAPTQVDGAPWKGDGDNCGRHVIRASESKIGPGRCAAVCTGIQNAGTRPARCNPDSAVADKGNDRRARRYLPQDKFPAYPPGPLRQQAT